MAAKKIHKLSDNSEGVSGILAMMRGRLKDQPEKPFFADINAMFAGKKFDPNKYLHILKGK